MKVSQSAKRFLLRELKIHWLRVSTIVILSVIAGILEAVGIGLVFPFIYLLVSPDAVHQFKFIAWAMHAMRIESVKSFNIVILAAIVVLITAKIIYVIWFRYF